MFSAVLDTVVFVRGLMNPLGRWGRLIFERAEEYRLVVSPEIEREVIDVISRPELVTRFRVLPGRDHDQVLTMLSRALVVRPALTPVVSRDPKDDKLLAAALAAKAEYLVSEDLDLLVLREHGGTRIVDAATFLRILDEGLVSGG